LPADFPNVDARYGNQRSVASLSGLARERVWSRN
jgi:hypothetical protein